VLSAAHHRRAHIPPCASGRDVTAPARVAAVHAAVVLATPGARTPPVGARAPAGTGVAAVTAGRMTATTISRQPGAPTAAIADPPTAMTKLTSTVHWFRHAMR